LFPRLEPFVLINRFLFILCLIISVATLHTSKKFDRKVERRPNLLVHSRLRRWTLTMKPQYKKPVSTEQPAQHDDQDEGSSYTSDKKSKVKDIPNSFKGEAKKIREAFENLRNAVILSTTTLENSFSQLKLKEERFNEISHKISSINFESSIKLNVGGNVYETSLETLTKHPESLLAEMFSTRFNLKQGSDGCYFVDRDGTHFRHILNYLRSGTAPVLSVLKTDAEEILQEAEYYGLVGLVKAINNKLDGDDANGGDNVKEESAVKESGAVDEIRKELSSTEEKLNLFLNLLDANLKELDEATKNYKKVSTKLSNIHFGENIKIDVGGRIFKTSLKTLRKEPESVLALMFSEKFDLKKEDDGSFFIDRDGTVFHHVLNYLRDGEILEDVIEDHEQQLQREAEFYGLSGLKELIHNYKHVKLNVGGRDFVIARETLRQYPESMFGKMLSGKECAVKKRDGSFCIERDGTNFHHILEYLKVGLISNDVELISNYVAKGCGVPLRDDAKFYMLPGLEEHIENVKINVGGREFLVLRSVLLRNSGGLFSDIFYGRKNDRYVKRSDGSYFIQYDGTNCHLIYDYLKRGRIPSRRGPGFDQGFCDELEFYGLTNVTRQFLENAQHRY